MNSTSEPTEQDITPAEASRPLEASVDTLDDGLQAFEDGDVDGLRAAAVSVHELLDALAGFEPVEAEIEDSDVKCAGCGEVAPASEMGVTADNTISNGDDVILSVERFYLCDDPECMLQFMEAQS